MNSEINNIIYLFKICTFISSVHIVFMFHLISLVKMKSTNWPAPNVWVFIAQMVEHSSANAEASKSRN